MRSSQPSLLVKRTLPKKSKNFYMKAKIVSDLHLEFGDINLPNTEKADILILAGDITVIRSALSEEYKKAKSKLFCFLNRISCEYETILYVPGNHEFYSSQLGSAVQIFREWLSPYTSIHLLDNEAFSTGSVVWVGGTLWVDSRKIDPLEHVILQRNINDFKVIYADNGNPITAHDVLKSHVDFLSLIDQEGKRLNEKQEMVVISHHAPSFRSIHARFKGSQLNVGFANHLDDFIHGRKWIRCWLHGHIHDSADYHVGNCRVICNPRGYFPQNLNPDFNSGLVFEIG
jgi:Icc-related predicted phosphoesterase